MRVLIVEDEEEIQSLIKIFLKPNAECFSAFDGLEALALFRARLATPEKFDLVLLDIMMPHLDGRQTLEAIRSLEREAGVSRLDGVKIIMLTALDGTKNIVGAFKNGCDGYLAKPFDDQQLIKEIKDLGLMV